MRRVLERRALLAFEEWLKRLTLIFFIIAY